MVGPVIGLGKQTPISNVFNPNCVGHTITTAALRFELRYLDPKPSVLPLDDTARC